MAQGYCRQNLELKDIWLLKLHLSIMMAVRRIFLLQELFYSLCIQAIHLLKNLLPLTPTTNSLSKRDTIYFGMHIVAREILDFSQIHLRN
jgi:hypothetical protein